MRWWKMLPVIVSEICQRFDLEKRQESSPVFTPYLFNGWLETTQFDLTQGRPAATLVVHIHTHEQRTLWGSLTKATFVL